MSVQPYKFMLRGQCFAYGLFFLVICNNKICAFDYQLVKVRDSSLICIKDYIPVTVFKVILHTVKYERKKKEYTTLAKG